ncbi:MAG: putative S-layer protein [Nanoarchaeota archaeon]
MHNKKIILLGALFLFLSIATAYAQTTSLTIVETTLQIDLAQGQTTTASFTVQNTGTTSISSVFDTSQLDLTDSNGKTITLTFSPTSPQITPNQSAVITITLKADSQISFEQFGGILTVKDNTTGSTAQDTLQLDIEVEPDVCDFGQVGSALQIDIKEPETSDEFKPGDTVSIEVEVENQGQNDIRVQVEAFLFHDNQNIADTSSTTRRIDETSDESFTLKLMIPVDEDDLEEDDELTLIVKAFDDEDEQLNCVQAKQKVNIELEDDDIVIDEAESQLFPSVAACGDVLSAAVKIVNIGSDDNENVVISVQNRELGINERSESFTLESFDSKEENTAIRHFQLTISATAQQKSYPLQMDVKFDGGSDSYTIPLNIISCDGQQPTGNLQEIIIKPLEKSFAGQRGKVLSVPVEIVNNQAKKAILIMSTANIEDFATATTKTITINPGAKTTVFFDLILHEQTTPGLYGATFLLKEGAQVIASTDVQIMVDETGITVQTKKQPMFPVIGDVPTSLLVIGNIIVFIFVLLAIRFALVTWKRSKI